MISVVNIAFRCINPLSLALMSPALPPDAAAAAAAAPPAAAAAADAPTRKAKNIQISYLTSSNGKNEHLADQLTGQ